MNYRIISKLLGYLCGALAVLMAPTALWAIWFQEWEALRAVMLSMMVSMSIGGALALAGRHAPDRMYQREALGLVGISWLVAAGLGALPFIFSGVLGPVDAYFESMSGFTTTGSSVFSAQHFVETPRSIFFWRSFTHWLGGMGIIVLFIAVLPYLGAGGKQLFRSESPGPDPRGLKPRIKDTASVLYKIYLGFTLVQTIALMIAGMNFFEALCHTFGTLATGGFSTRAASVAEFNSPLIDGIIVFFMVCAGANFALYFGILRGDWRSLFRDTEWRVYILILAGCTLAITVNLLGVQGVYPVGGEGIEPVYHSFLEAFRYAIFQVVSVMTTTGFATADFDLWPAFSRMLLVMIMFVGGCAGSTGGGLKVVRVILLAKMMYRRLESTFRPKLVRAVRVSGEVIDEPMQNMVYGFFVLYLVWFALGTIVMSALGLPFTAALTSVAATLNNIGPGLETLGPMANFASIPDVGKIFLSLCMALGRLELFSICVLLMPAFWRSN